METTQTLESKISHERDVFGKTMAVACVVAGFALGVTYQTFTANNREKNAWEQVHDAQTHQLGAVYAAVSAEEKHYAQLAMMARQRYFTSHDERDHDEYEHNVRNAERLNELLGEFNWPGPRVHPYDTQGYADQSKEYARTIELALEQPDDNYRIFDLRKALMLVEPLPVKEN